MPKKPKSDECDKGRCQNTRTFLSHSKKAQRANFCPKYNKDSKTFDRILPAINHDKKSYTPFFILEEEQSFYKENDARFKGSHQKRIEDCVSKSDLLVPRHVRKRQFCSVCKVVYEQYLEHIETDDHKHMLRKNKYSEYICDLQKLFEKVPQQPPIQEQIQQSQKFFFDFTKSA